MQRDLTTGNLGKSIAVFSWPFFLSYFLQALYGLADMFFIGMFNGPDVITAVSVGSQLLHMATVMTVGFCVAVTVLIGRAFGAGDRGKIPKIIGNSISLLGISGVVVTVILLLLRGSLIRVMKTPAVSQEQAVTYVTIVFAGVIFVIAYNLIAAIFRGFGDSKTPLYFVAAAAVVNIVLDYVFIGPLHMRAAGAALGTIIAQAVSVILSIIAIRRRNLIGRIRLSDLKFVSEIQRPLVKVGLPVMLQEGFIQISFIFITVIANTRGVEIAAAVGIVEKILGFLFLVPSTMNSTTAAVAAQNIGASRLDRAKKAMWICMGINTAICAVLVLFCNLFPNSIVGWFTSDPTVINYGAQYFRPYSTDCLIAGVHFCFGGYFTARGRSYISFLHNAIAIVTLRVPGAWFASIHWPTTLFPMGCCAPLASLLSDFICLGFFLWLQRLERRATPGQTKKTVSP